MKKYLLETVKTLIILAIVIVGVGIVQAAWTGPATTPLPNTPPNNNTSAPLNTGPYTQEKEGILGFHGFYSLGTGWVSTTTVNSAWPLGGLTFSVNGSMGASAYCDERGVNCSQLEDLILGADQFDRITNNSMSSTGAPWNTTVTVDKRSVIRINVNAHAARSIADTGGLARAIVTIDGNDCGVDQDARDGTSSITDLYASTACVRKFEAGTHTISVRMYQEPTTGWATLSATLDYTTFASPDPNYN